MYVLASVTFALNSCDGLIERRKACMEFCFIGRYIYIYMVLDYYLTAIEQHCTLVNEISLDFLSSEVQ